MAYGDTWADLAGSNGSWRGICCSADGAIVYGAAQDGLYKSTDYGASFTQLTPVDWFEGIACSDDGTKIVACGYSDIYVSTDSGANWTTHENGPTYFKAACSADGSKMVVCVASPSGNVWVSSDSGANWTTKQTTGYFYSVACSADGSTIFAGSDNLYKSTDAGSNWTTARSGQTDHVCCSEDGATVYAFNQADDKTYVSLNGGNSWTDTGLPLLAANRFVKCSATGSKAIAGDSGSGSYIYVTEDSGATWNPYCIQSESYWDGAVADAGDFIYVAARFSSIYKSENAVAPAGPTATLTGGYTYTVAEPPCSAYWVDRYAQGVPSAGQLMLYHVAIKTVDFSAGLATSKAACVTAPDAETVYSIQLDGIEVGTCTFAASANIGSFAAPADFQTVPGSLLSIVAPSTPDASQADVTFTLVGTCANAPTPSGGCCNTIRVDMTTTATLAVQLTNIPRPRVQFNARAVTMGRLTNA